MVVCADFSHALEATGGTRAKRLTYGLGAGDFRAAEIRIAPDGAHFTITRDGRRITDEIHLPIGGRMNVANALGVWVLLWEFGVSEGEIAAGLASFRGVARRQEVVGEARGIVVIDDFAHHPTAIRATLEAIAERYEGRRMVAAFEPRSNSARRRVFQQGFATAFDCAARVYLGPVYFKENDPIAPGERLDTAALAAAIGARGPAAFACESTTEIFERMTADARAGDVMVCMSNGPFDDLPRKLAAALAG
jgi:UDP-N-acetylmuramate: L-alanyl-gamma-D-glutamyl-meso-diaminopimelate ligase